MLLQPYQENLLQCQTLDHLCPFARKKPILVFSYPRFSKQRFKSQWGQQNNMVYRIQSSGPTGLSRTYPTRFMKTLLPACDCHTPHPNKIREPFLFARNGDLAAKRSAFRPRRKTLRKLQIFTGIAPCQCPITLSLLMNLLTSSLDLISTKL